jgi:uncharacterized protein (TIGR02452 family)
MAKRSMRAQIAQETLAILQRGSYTTDSGQVVPLASALDQARSGSLVYSPQRLTKLLLQCDLLLSEHPNQPPTSFEVVNKTTLDAARRLIDDEPHGRVLALNFASPNKRWKSPRPLM